MISRAEAEESMRLFASEVMPHFARARPTSMGLRELARPTLAGVRRLN